MRQSHCPNFPARANRPSCAQSFDEFSFSLRSPYGDKNPEPFTSYPTSIFRAPVGKEKRDALHNLVHHFRELHSFKEDIYAPQNPHYWKWVTLYSHLTPPKEEALAIETLSSLEGYADIRQAGRMRISCSPLPKSEMKVLCKEIRAALIWASRKGCEG